MTTRILLTYNPANLCIGITKVLWHDVYIYCLIGIIVVTIINVLIIDSLSKHDEQYHTREMNRYASSTEIMIIIINLVLKWGCVLVLCKMLFKYIFLADLKPILCLYVSKIIAFADIYLLVYRINPSSFSVPNRNTSLTMTFINYSVSCQTLTGISSTSPKSILAEFLTAIQLILLGITYDIFVLSIAVLRFCEPDELMSASASSIQCPRLGHQPSTNALTRRLSCMPNESYRTPKDKIMNTPRLKYRMGTFTDCIIHTPLKSGKSTMKSHGLPRSRLVSSWEVNKSSDSRPRSTKSSTTDEDKSDFQFPTVPASCPVVKPRHDLSPLHEDKSKNNAFKIPLSKRKNETAQDNLVILNTYETSAPDLTKPCVDEPKADRSASQLGSLTNSLNLSFFPDLDALQSNRVIDASTKKLIYERNRWMGRGSVKWLYKHMTLMLVGTEIPRLVAMYLSCSDLRCDSNNVLLIVGIALDSLLLILSLFGVLMKMSLIHTLPQAVKVNITIRSLIRVFLTLVVLFGILQFDIWVITKDTADPAYAVDVATVDIHRYWLMMGHFMFFSVSTFTNAGVGDNITKLSEIGQNINNIQMLLALVFSVVVFGVGLLRLGEEREKAMEKFVDSEILQIQNKKSEKKNAISYLSIDASAPEMETIHELVRQKSTMLRKQGLLPGTVTPMVTLARQRSATEQTERYESCYHSL